MRDFWKHFTHRTLRVNILSLFLTLFCTAFACIISFSFYKNYQSILKFSVGTVERVSQVVLERIKALIIDAEQVPTIASDLFTNLEDISLNNKYLLPFIINAVEYDPNFSGFYIGTQEGNYIGASNISLSERKYYITHPSVPLASNIRYLLFIVNSTQNPPSRIMQYKDANFQTVCTEDISNDAYPFDPRNRPWYPKNSSREYIWSDVYQFFRTGQLGLSVSLPIFSDEEELIGGVGVDISIQMLSRFLAQQEVGRTGKVFILNNKGKILIAPEEKTENHKDISPEIVSFAYQQYAKANQESFIFKYKDIKYLANIHALLLNAEKQWLITVIVPLSDFFSNVLQTQRYVLLITIGMIFITGWLVFLTSKRISSPIVQLAGEVDRVTQLHLENKERILSNIKEIQLMDSSISKLKIAMRSFALYVPRKVVQMLLQRGEEIRIGGERKEISIFFSDISGFTAIAEVHSVEFLLDLLSEYFDGLSTIILNQDGVIDKFIGDSVMAFWGAPLDIPDHAIKACMAALLCQKYLRAFNQHQREAKGQELITRIAIHSGEVIVGNIGAPERMNYTVIGDVVNIAAHLQSINKIYHTHINITEETYKRVEHAFIGRPLDIVEVKGRKKKMKIYELMAAKEGDAQVRATKEQIDLCNSFTDAYEAFYRGELEAARKMFEAVLERFPEDFPTQIYLSRLK